MSAGAGTIVQVRRDPFARTTLERQAREDRGDGCGWCGQRRRSMRLFHFRQMPDGLRPVATWTNKGFCGVTCFDAYEA